MKSKNIPIFERVELTGLSKEEIDKLQICENILFVTKKTYALHYHLDSTRRLYKKFPIFAILKKILYNPVFNS